MAMCRERWIATFEGKPVDRFPVWLKLAGPAWLNMQPTDVQEMDDLTLQRTAGLDPVTGNETPRFVETPSRCRISSTDDADGNAVQTIETPDGPLVSVTGFDPHSGIPHPLVYPATTEETFARLRWLYDTQPKTVLPESTARLQAVYAHYREADAFVFASIESTPFMELVKDKCGPEAFVYLMADIPEQVEALMEQMHAARLRTLKAALPHMACDMVWLIEDTSSRLLTPDWFRRYCVPHMSEYCQLIRQHGKYPVLHMCGHLHELLDDIARIPAAANEAYTTPPLGDVTLADARRRMPDRTILGGTNAVLMLQSVEEIVQAVRADLAQCPDRLRIALTSAGVLPPRVSLEQARVIAEALKQV